VSSSGAASTAPARRTQQEESGIETHGTLPQIQPASSSHTSFISAAAPPVDFGSTGHGEADEAHTNVEQRPSAVSLLLTGQSSHPGSPTPNVTRVQVPDASNNAVNVNEDIARNSEINITNNTQSGSEGVTQHEGPRGRTNDFRWGSRQGQEIREIIEPLYNEVVHWRRNIFMPPSGAATKQMIKECTKLIYEVVNNAPGTDISFYALMIMPHLLLQRPTPKSKSKQHVAALNKRMILWRDGKLEELVAEGRTIQRRLQRIQRGASDTKGEAENFANLMRAGKVKPAMRLLTSKPTGILSMNSETMGLLQEKHPEASETSEDAIVSGPKEYINPIIYESIDASLIRKMACTTKGSAGPSGLDADAWRKLLTHRSYGNDAIDLCKAIAALARKLCSIDYSKQDISPNLEAFTASRLIPLKKNPGVRPIGVGEVLRRIIGSAVMNILAEDVQAACGPLQLCAGQRAGCEAAIHALKRIHDSQQSEAVLMVDAENAFNRLNRKVMLANTEILCPTMATFVRNCYSTSPSMFVTGGVKIKSNEGTTQGDPIAMAIYAIGISPLLQEVSGARAHQTVQTTTNDNVSIDSETTSASIDCEAPSTVKIVAYADDLSASGSLHHLRQWWSKLSVAGEKYGYYPNPSKSCLIVKNEKMDEAKKIFQNMMQITSEGARHLGASIGSPEFKRNYIQEKVETWTQEITKLSKFAETQPHAAYTAFTFGLRNRWTYAMRTLPDIAGLMMPLESEIQKSFIPALFGIRISARLRRLVALPARMGGMGIIDPTAIADDEHSNSIVITDQIVNSIIQQKSVHEMDPELQRSNLKRISTNRNEKQTELLNEIKEEITNNDLNSSGNEELKMIESCQEKCASNWLTALPIADKGFALNKQEFQDAIRLRYRLELTGLPQNCVCGADFTIDHTMICKKGGFITHRHNELRDVTAEMLSEVCHDVNTEPELTALTGEHLNRRTANSSDEAKVDISARGFWIRGQRAFFDVRVFHPFAQSYRNRNLHAIHRQHEQEKRRTYGERILQIEMGSFTPLIFSTSGGIASNSETAKFYVRLAELIADKRDNTKNEVMTWVRCRISFSLVRSALLCLRGTRTRQKVIERIQDTAIDVAVRDSQLR
jgi:hypothetical protein